MALLLVLGMPSHAQKAEWENAIVDAGLDYFKYDKDNGGGNAYGFHISMYVPNGLGFTIGGRSSLKEHAPYMMDLLANGNYPLWRKNKFGVFFGGELGPAVCAYQVLNNKNKWTTKAQLNAVIGLGLIVKYDKFVLNLGGRYEAGKFKFNEENTAEYLRVGLGYTFH